MTQKTLAWNVDTQIDFMRSNGKLPVQEASNIEDKLAQLTKLFKQTGTQVVNTRDWHTLEDEEIVTQGYDFKTTYPPHCLADTPGAQYVPATNPHNPLVVRREQSSIDSYLIKDHRNIVMNKNKFDVFAGNPHTESVLDVINPDQVVVYGVATNVCVDQAVQGLLRTNRDVYVVGDAIKALPDEQAQTPEQEILEDWNNKGVTMVQTNEVREYLR